MNPYREPSPPPTPHTRIRIRWGRVLAWTLFVIVVSWVIFGGATLGALGYHFSPPRAFR